MQIRSSFLIIKSIFLHDIINYLKLKNKISNLKHQKDVLYFIRYENHKEYGKVIKVTE